MSGPGRRWNHNTHYYPLVLAAVPDGCRRALDVGCGEGMLARELAVRVPQVVGIDKHEPSIALAREQGPAGRVEYVLGDFLEYPFPAASFGLVSCVAALHHLDPAAALTRMAGLLAPAARWWSAACPVPVVRPSPGRRRGGRQPRLPGGQGLLAPSVADRVAAAAHGAEVSNFHLSAPVFASKA